MKIFHIFNPFSKEFNLFGSSARDVEVQHWDDDYKCWSKDLNTYSDRILVPQINLYYGSSLEQFADRIESILPAGNDAILTTSEVKSYLEDSGEYIYRFNYGLVTASNFQLPQNKDYSSAHDLMLDLNVEFIDSSYHKYEAELEIDSSLHVYLSPNASANSYYNLQYKNYSASNTITFGNVGCSLIKI